MFEAVLPDALAVAKSKAITALSGLQRSKVCLFLGVCHFRFRQPTFERFQMALSYGKFVGLFGC